MRRTIIIAISVIALTILIAGCSPKIYLVDRPTIMEQEAAGEWPDLEKNSEQGAVKVKPEPLTPAQMGRTTDRSLRTPEGDPGIEPGAGATPVPASERK